MGELLDELDIIERYGHACQHDDLGEITKRQHVLVAFLGIDVPP